jgi:hypothetical protein
VLESYAVPRWTDRVGGWHQIDTSLRLEAGRHLRTTTGAAAVTHVRNYTRVQTMRDLTVGTFHTYYVIAGHTPVLVHNCETKVYRAPHKGVDESQGLDPTNFPTVGRHEGTAYLGDSEKVARQYAGRGDYQEGYHEFTMNEGFLDDFHPTAFRRFHDDEGGLQWLIPQADIELFNSHIVSVRWIPWRRGIEF